MSNIIVRHADKNDDFISIAKCIYYTDPFIYPTAFGDDPDNAAKAIAVLMDVDQCILNYKNIYVATINNAICGILLYNEDGAVWDAEKYYELIKEFSANKVQFEYASNYYFIEESEKPAENHIEIVAVCVSAEHRRKGIANTIIKTFTEEKGHKILTLDVLADNSSAIKTYEKAGFSATERYKGFGPSLDKRPDCYHMVREI